nr:uncharacterized N-acetyltransferase P20-like [Ipomoea batatas]
MDSSRISLRAFQLSDADDLLKWANDDKVTHFLRWNPITSKQEALKYIQEVAIPHPWRHSICLDGRSIGYISVKPEAGNDRHRAHLGYAIGSCYWGQGIVTMALKMAIPVISPIPSGTLCYPHLPEPQASPCEATLRRLQKPPFSLPLLQSLCPNTCVPRTETAHPVIGCPLHEIIQVRELHWPQRDFWGF